jgi:hypothetical protein
MEEKIFNLTHSSENDTSEDEEMTAQLKKKFT